MRLAEHLLHKIIPKNINRIITFNTDAVRMGENGKYGTGLFPLFSRLNHSCNANVHHSYNVTIGKETVQATRQINKGDELVTAYGLTAWRTKDQRAEILEQGWNFSCACKACAGPKAAKIEERRGGMFEIDQILATYEAGFPSLFGWGVPTTAQQALALAEEMLDLLREEGIIDFQVAEV